MQNPPTPKGSGGLRTDTGCCLARAPNNYDRCVQHGITLTCQHAVVIRGLVEHSAE